MSRLDSSSCFSGCKSGSLVENPRKEKSQQLACDRCRGQKLRCIRSSNSKTPCERCQKAGATCIIDTGVRMGRPRRADKEQPRENSGSAHHPSQTTRSSPPPEAESQTRTAVDFAMDTDAWLVHDLDDTPVDPTLQSVTVQYLDPFDFALPGEGTLDDESVNLPTEHFLIPNMDLSADHSIPARTEYEQAAIGFTEPLNGRSRYSPMRQEIMQELSDLNMQLSRQLGAATSTGTGFTNNDSALGLTALATPPEESRTLCDTVVFMMQSLQTYHRLLVDIVRPNHSATFGSHDNRKFSTVTSSCLSPVEELDIDDSRSRISETTGRSPLKRRRTDSSVDFSVAHEPSHSTSVDMPTSLLLLSCHTNLLHLCRNTFAAIRAGLFATRRQINLFTISFLNIMDVSLPPDPDLQIIVLIQAVVRMVDKIGRLLGYPNECEAGSSGNRCESDTRSSVIPRHLLELMLKSEGCGNGSADRAGTKALKEEIRGLHELVYKPV